jgi:hypothetical protein
MAASVSLAGEVQLSWNPSENASGYRAHWGPVAGEPTGSSDVGPATQTTIDGITDCTMWQFAVTAYNEAGESELSASVASWPRATFVSADPAVVEQDTQVSVAISGTNFRDVDDVQLSHPGVQITGATVGCHQMLLTLNVAADATPGPVNVTVTHPSSVAGTVSALFSVAEPQADVTPPEITGVGATEVDGTSAVIVWSTDEPADGLVRVRKQGHTNYRTVAVAGLSTEHAVSLTGLEPETTYEYHVSSTDEAGNTTTTTPDHTFSTTTSPYHYLRLEPENGTLEGQVQRTEGGGAFNGAWLDTPDGLGQGSSGNPLGVATHGALIPESGTWYLWVRMYGFDTDANSFYESVDGSARAIIGIPDYDEWSWVAGDSYSLDAGLTVVELAGRENRTRADRLLLTNDPDFVPTEEPDVDLTPPGPVAGFTAAPGVGQISLSWSNPVAGDLDRTVIRYRTDGQYPTGPLDGFEVTDQPASSGSPDGHVHHGVESGLSYYYSAFSMDEAGNVSTAVHALGAAVGAPPPPQNVAVY